MKYRPPYYIVWLLIMLLLLVIIISTSKPYLEPLILPASKPQQVYRITSTKTEQDSKTITFTIYTQHDPSITLKEKDVVVVQNEKPRTLHQPAVIATNNGNSKIAVSIEKRSVEAPYTILVEIPYDTSQTTYSKALKKQVSNSNTTQKIVVQFDPVVLSSYGNSSS